jgi:transcriptional regulator with XRE-family HTH domain
MADQIDKARDFASVNVEILRRHPEAAAAWERIQPALQLVLMLVRLRKSRGLTQAAIAERAGWDKSFVSRLERPGDRMPDLLTVNRYLEACDARAGLVVATADTPAHLHVEDAVSLGASEAAQQMFEGLRDRDIDFDDAMAGAAR